MPYTYAPLNVDQEAIQRSAQRMIANFGLNAANLALSVADRMRYQADSDGEQFWLQIADAIEKLQSFHQPQQMSLSPSDMHPGQ